MLYPRRSSRGISDIQRNTADVTGGKPFAVLLQYISGVSAISPLVAFYDIHGDQREVLFFYFVPDTTRDTRNVIERVNSQEKTLGLLPARGRA
jgi:hypothetical protein